MRSNCILENHCTKKAIKIKPNLMLLVNIYPLKAKQPCRDGRILLNMALSRKTHKTIPPFEIKSRVFAVKIWYKDLWSKDVLTFELPCS